MPLTDVERQELERRRHSRIGRPHDARQARCLLLATGASWAQIRGQLRCGDRYSARGSQRFAAERLPGLYSRHGGQPATCSPLRLKPRFLAGPVGDRRTARRIGVRDGWARRWGSSHMMVARVWAKQGLKPHRLERSMASDDPDFERKAADIIGL